MFVPSIFEDITSALKLARFEPTARSRDGISTINKNEILINLAGYEPNNIKVDFIEQTRILLVSATSGELEDEIQLKYYVSASADIDSAELKNGLLKIKLKSKDQLQGVRNIQINVNVTANELKNGSLKIESN